MKKIVSTQGLLYGCFDDQMVSTALRDRVNHKLEYGYNQLSTDGDIHVNSKFSYELFDGVVVSMTLSYTVSNPTAERLRDFRDTCDSFYNLHGFMVDSESTATPCVTFKATDIYDMASLLHALAYQDISLEPVMCAVDSNLTEKAAIYSPSGNYLLQLPDIPQYSVKEGTMFISPLAFQHCKRLRRLDIPVGIVNYKEALKNYTYPLKVKVWKLHYDGSPLEADDEDEDTPYVLDECQVGYSEDGKRLMFCRWTFNMVRYEVPDGVEEIDDCAFVSCRHYLELSIPRSVRHIGDYIFGNGGHIEIREK